MNRSNYKNQRILKHVPLEFLLKQLESLSEDLQKKDVENNQIYKVEFIKLKQLVDEITLRLS